MTPHTQVKIIYYYQMMRRMIFELVAKLNPSISNGSRKDEGRFDFNKDAGMFVRLQAIKLCSVRKDKGKTNL